MRARVIKEMRAPRQATGKTCCSRPAVPANVCWSDSRATKLKPLTGKTLAEVAKLRGTSPEDTAIDLVIEDGSRVEHRRTS